VQPHDLNYLVEFAHSDSLQLLVTGGIIGLLFAAMAFALFARRLGQHWWQERAREESALALAGLGALAASVLHGLVEFNMSIPAIPATLAILLGLSWAATQDDDHSRNARSSHSSS
jgi:O-antigen ligase